MMTTRLYWQDAYLKKCKAKVVKIENDNVWLDQTCFYPESGGQSGDKGLINLKKVLNTKFDQDKNIFHVVEKSDFNIGEAVEIEIDWERRYKIMKIHSASHIMEYFLFHVFGPLKLLGCNCNEERDSSTYGSDELPLDKLSKVEQLSNDFILKNYPIETFEDKERKNFRWWKCGEILLPCGGTHPKNTSEIGKITIKREKGGSGKEKVITRLF
jgi:alanyl-tRNA synthetase